MRGATSRAGLFEFRVFAPAIRNGKDFDPVARLDLIAWPGSRPICLQPTDFGMRHAQRFDQVLHGGGSLKANRKFFQPVSAGVKSSRSPGSK